MLVDHRPQDDRSIARPGRGSSDFDHAFWSGEPLDELFDQVGAAPRGAAEKIFAAGMMEWRRSHRQDGELIAGAQARIDRTMDVAIGKESRRAAEGPAGSGDHRLGGAFRRSLRHGLRHHARLHRDRAAQNTNLAVVAPGIAEALLATGLGLMAAIPAVIFYNKLSADADRIVAGYEAFADEFSTILSRQLDA